MDLRGLKQLHQNIPLEKIIDFGLFAGVSHVNILDIIVYCFVTSSFASLRSLSISFCIDIKKAGIIVTSECKLCKFNNSCKEFFFLIQLLCLTTVLMSSSECQDSFIILVTVSRQLHLNSFVQLSALVLKFIK